MSFFFSGAPIEEGDLHRQVGNTPFRPGKCRLKFSAIGDIGLKVTKSLAANGK